MASFTDTQLPKFNPYIQQQPVEAMTAVGTQRQKAHEEGVQKIQTQIDNIAGLQVGRDVDKAYLQSKINELGNDLRSVAAGDFSNFQLVNSTGGMIKQIGNDPFIRAGVSATANDSKQMEMMEEDRKKGTLTPQAEHFYSLKRNSYYSNSSLKGEDGKPINYSGKYIQSWDIDKNILEAIKAVGDKKWSKDNVFKMVNGQIAKDKNGQPILSDYATREKKEGRFSDSVSAAIDGVLNRPEAKQELTMRGVYNYRGYDSIDDFVDMYEREKDNSVKLLESKKFDFMEKMASSTDPEERKQYQEVINQIDSRIEGEQQDAELKENQAREFGDLEAYKAAYETMKVKNSYMQSGVTETTSTEIIENIPYKAQQKRIEDERNWWAQKDASARGWKGLDYEKMRIDADAEKWKYDPKNPANIIAAGDIAVKKGITLTPQYSKLNESIDEANADLEKNKADLIFEYMSAINYGNGKDLSPAKIKEGIAGYAKKDPEFMDKMYIKAMRAAVDDKIIKNPLYSKFVSSVPNVLMAEQNVDYMGGWVDSMNKDEGVRKAGSNEVGLEKLEKGYKPITMTYTKDGHEVKATLSARDAMDIAIIRKNIAGGALRRVRTAFTNSPAEEEEYQQATKRIEAKYDTNAYYFSREAEEGARFKGIPMITENKNYKPIYDAVHHPKFEAVLAAKEKYLQEHAFAPENTALNIYSSGMKQEEKDDVDQRMQVVLNNNKISGAVGDFALLKTDKENYSTQIELNRGSQFAPKQEYTLNLYNKDELVKSVPLSIDEASYIKGYKINPPAGPSRVAQSLLRSQDSNTTNRSSLPPNSPNAYKSSVYPQTYFAQRYNTTDVYGADIIKGSTGGFNIYFYVKDPASGSKIGVPAKKNAGDVYPHPFNTIDAAAEYIDQKITSKAYLESLIKQR